jgi:hypothetical protein
MARRRSPAELRAIFAKRTREKVASIRQRITPSETSRIARAAILTAFGAGVTGAGLFLATRGNAPALLRRHALATAGSGLAATAAGGGTLLERFRSSLKTKTQTARVGASAIAREKAARVGGAFRTMSFAGVTPEVAGGKTIDWIAAIAEDSARRRIEGAATNLQHSTARLIGAAQHDLTAGVVAKGGEVRRRALKLAKTELRPEESARLMQRHAALLDAAKKYAEDRNRLLRSETPGKLLDVLDDVRKQMISEGRIYELGKNHLDEKMLRERLALSGITPDEGVMAQIFRANELANISGGRAVVRRSFGG